MLSADAIVDLQDQLTRAWHQAPEPRDRHHRGCSDAGHGWRPVARQHRANFDLWHIEDEARAPGATDARTGRRQAPHRPDQPAPQRPGRGTGPRVAGLAGSPGPAQPGSAASLRVAGPDHRPALHPGAQDLPHPRRGGTRTTRPPAMPSATASGWPSSKSSAPTWPAAWTLCGSETLAGTRRFKLYRQLKMYNDPSLNPAIYRKTSPIGADR